MRLEAGFRRRAAVGESVPELHRALIGRLADAGVFDKSRIDVVKFDPGTGESAAADLTPALDTPATAAITYASRLPKSLRDAASSDDVLTIVLESDGQERLDLCRGGFLRIATAFGAYRAAVVTDLDLALDDFETTSALARSTGKDVDGRDSVYRFHPANFLDDTLCRRAFDLSAGQVVARIGTLCAVARVEAGGALLILDDVFAAGAALVARSDELMAALSHRSVPE
jgi:hypothetical protein